MIYGQKCLLLLVQDCEKFKIKALADLVFSKVVLFGLDDRAFFARSSQGWKGEKKKNSSLGCLL